MLTTRRTTPNQTAHGWLAALALLLLGVVVLLPWQATPPATGTTTAVSFSLPSGYYPTSQQLTLTAPANATIWLTSDGSEPGPTNGRSITQPIHLNAAVPGVAVLRARAQLADGTLGPISDAHYILGLSQPLPIVSLLLDPAALWDETSGIYRNPLAEGIAWERPVSVMIVTGDRQTAVTLPAGVRIHGQFSRGYAKKSLRLYFRQEYGTNRLTFPLFANTPPLAIKRLVLHASGQDSSQLPTNWTLLRNQVVAELAQSTHALTTHSQSALLFINGEPWGHYYLREHINDYLLREGYGAETAVLVDTPARRAEDPDDITPAYADWDKLTEFVATHDLADEASYAAVAAQVDLDNLIDYSLLQIYSANYDWPYTNIKQFRPATINGRWRWIIWDNDLSLGLTPWSNVGQNTLEQALDPAYTAGVAAETDGRDTILLRGLLQNPAFRARFIARADELLNTVLAPEAVIAVIDRLAAEIKPAIALENGRWGGDTATWEANVEQLRDFARQRPAIMRQHFAESLP
ncbi:MAG: CotH kinase family protein [Chloroflexota bacterium]